MGLVEGTSHEGKVLEQDRRVIARVRCCDKGVLPVEVVVEQRGRDPCSPGYLLDAKACWSHLLEDREGSVHDLESDLLLVACPRWLLLGDLHGLITLPPGLRIIQSPRDGIRPASQPG